MTATLESVRALITKVKVERKDREIALLQEAVNAAQVAYDLLLKKQSAAAVELSAREDAVNAIRRDLTELASVEEALSAEQYKEAYEVLMGAQQAALARVEETRTLQAELRSQISASVDVLRMDRDKLLSLRDPHFKPPQESVTNAVLMAHSSPKVLEWFKRAENLRAELSSLPSGELHRPLLVLLSLQLRQFQATHSINASEERLLTRCFGIMTLITRELRMPFIPSLTKSFEPAPGTTWGLLIREAEIVYRQALRKFEPADVEATAEQPTAPEPEEVDTEEEPEDDTAALRKELEECGLVEALRDRRLAIFGGNSTRKSAKRRVDLLNKLFKLRDVTWYEAMGNHSEGSQLNQSIRNGGVDVLIQFVMAHGHGASTHVTKTAKQHAVFVAPVNTTNIREWVDALKGYCSVPTR